MSWKLRNFFAPFRHRNFRLFAMGQMISLIGFWMQSVGQSWLVYRMTGSSTYLGLTAFLQQIPVLLLALLAGGIVDRTDRHRMVVFTQACALLQASLLAVLTYTGKIKIGYIFVLAVLLGIISAFDLPARQAFLIQMVGKDNLINAIAVNSSMFNAARMVGPALAGLVVARWGEALCFLINAVSYLAVLAALLAMRITRAQIEVKQRWSKDLIEGFHYIRDTRSVRVLLQLLGFLGIAGFPFVVLLPIFADAIFQRGAGGLGLLMTGTGIGALTGALALAGRKGFRGTGRIIRMGAVGFSASLLVFSLSTYFWLSFALMCFVGFFMMITVACINTAIQSIIPDALRGRVMSFFTMMLIGTAPIGSLIAGAAAGYLGAQATVFAFALICMAAALWFYRAAPKITREVRRLYMLQNPPLAGGPIPEMTSSVGADRE